MRYIVDEDLSGFPFWGQAKTVADNFSDRRKRIKPARNLSHDILCKSR